MNFTALMELNLTYFKIFIINDFRSRPYVWQQYYWVHYSLFLNCIPIILNQVFFQTFYFAISFKKYHKVNFLFLANLNYRFQPFIFTTRIVKVSFESTLIQPLVFILKYLYLKVIFIIVFYDLKRFVILFVAKLILFVIIRNFFTFIDSKFQIIANCWVSHILYFVNLLFQSY